MTSDRRISVIGLGYVGLPLAVAFGHKMPTVGFDVNKKRIEQLKKHNDQTGEVSAEKLKATAVTFTSSVEDIQQCDFHIVAVPTPINEAKQPDLTPILKATATLAQVIKKGDVVVYESTVYPGVTEDECVPLLERLSGLRCGEDFKVGYSPERINPGDHERTLEKIVKVVSGQDEESLRVISQTYSKIIQAGVHEAKSIKIAEAAKVIENTQRDLNIALMNELAIIFDRLGIDTQAVLEAAGTKWNFLKFHPGLVGGHCIGVDPYYLTHKAEMVGYHPQVILAGRRINDSMGKYIANQTVKCMIHAGHNVLGSCVTVLGMTFKENCPDTRNSKVIDIIRELQEFGANVQVHDPLAEPDVVEHEYGMKLTAFDDLQPADAVIVAVGHDQFKSLKPEDFKKISNSNPVFIDVKSLFNKNAVEEAGFTCWRL